MVSSLTNFFDEFFWRNFLMNLLINFFYEFFLRFFLTNCFHKFFDEDFLLTFNMRALGSEYLRSCFCSFSGQQRQETSGKIMEKITRPVSLMLKIPLILRTILWFWGHICGLVDNFWDMKLRGKFLGTMSVITMLFYSQETPQPYLHQHRASLLTIIRRSRSYVQYVDSELQNDICLYFKNLNS